MKLHHDKSNNSWSAKIPGGNASIFTHYEVIDLDGNAIARKRTRSAAEEVAADGMTLREIYTICAENGNWLCEGASAYATKAEAERELVELVELVNGMRNARI